MSTQLGFFLYVSDLFPSSKKGRKRPAQTKENIPAKKGKFDKDKRVNRDSQKAGHKDRDDREKKGTKGKRPLTDMDKIKRRKMRIQMGKQNKNRNKSKRGQKVGKKR